MKPIQVSLFAAMLLAASLVVAITAIPLGAAPGTSIVAG
jgi:hypothetical protein